MKTKTLLEITILICSALITAGIVLCVAGSWWGFVILFPSSWLAHVTAKQYDHVFRLEIAQNILESATKLNN